MRKIPAALKAALYLPGIAFEALIRVRNGLYSAAWLSPNRLPRPVISVGNITMGGSGKTPLTIHIAQTLAQQGFKPAILSRGYKRSSSNRTHILAPRETVSSPARTLGDEPAMIQRRFPSAWLGISKDRFLAGNMIAEKQPEAVFILDDGFQHRKLYRDLDIVILDGSRPLKRNRLFPRGTLREPLSALSRCHAVVINRASQGEAGNSIEQEVLNLHPKVAIFRCDQKIESFVPFSSWSGQSAQTDQPKSAFLVAAVGNPERFEQDIRHLDISVRGTRFYPDHCWLKMDDWSACVEEARSKDAEAIIITEKDAIKISQPPDFPLLVAVQATRISDEKAFELLLRECIERRF